LSDLVDRELNNLSARGKESPLVYVAGYTLPDNYSVRGKYTVKEGIVTLRVSLYKGQKEKLYSFDINGKIDNESQLALDIIEKINTFFNTQSN